MPAIYFSFSVKFRKTLGLNRLLVKLFFYLDEHVLRCFIAYLYCQFFLSMEAEALIKDRVTFVDRGKSALSQKLGDFVSSIDDFSQKPLLVGCFIENMSSGMAVDLDSILVFHACI